MSKVLAVMIEILKETKEQIKGSDFMYWIVLGVCFGLTLLTNDDNSLFSGLVGFVLLTCTLWLILLIGDFICACLEVAFGGKRDEIN